MTDILDGGSADGPKGAIHLATFGLATTMLAYNAIALTQRPGRRLAINVLVYAALAIFEAHHTHEHWRSHD